MTPDDHRRAAELFHRIRDFPEAERAVALDSACGGNPELHAHVQRLLEADSDADSELFLKKGALEDVAGLLVPDSDLPAPGTVIGHYRLLGRIGAGGMGVVYEGQDLRLQRRVAIKVLPLPLAEGSERIRRFQREARAISQLNHPNIVSIFDADFSEGHYYIAMELVEGKTLRQLIADQPPLPDVQSILDVIGQTASALNAAHEAGIIHRDIKPENIMVRPDGFVKVLDFGLAKLLDPASNPANDLSELRTRPGTLAGTIQYLSPEQVYGKPISPRSDLFSLGVVAYEFATGVRPFDGPTDGALFDAILNREPALPSAVRSTLTPEIDRLITQALEKDPDLRFQTAGDLRSFCRRVNRDYIARNLEEYRETSSQRIAPPEPSEPDVPKHRARNSLRWAFAIAIVVVGAAAFSWSTRSPAPLRVKRIFQVTTDGATKRRLVNDGTRLYYAAGNRDPDIKVFQIKLNGGEPARMPGLTGMLPLDISPDHSELLLAQILKGANYEGTNEGSFPLWIADVLGNAPRRVGDISAQEARWFPDGSKILYANGAELRIARNDGLQSRSVATVQGLIRNVECSPDGRHIRFTLDAGLNGGQSTKKSPTLWEVEPDGTNLHELFREWEDYTPESGVWTPDGKYFVFTAGQSGARDLWAVRENRGLFEIASPAPMKLTAGPMKVNRAKPSPDGRRILFLGEVVIGQLVRHDPKSNQWAPFAGGIAAMQVDFSRDGKWITYIGCPDGSAWRLALDGSERLQLTTPPFFATNPRWSPDGSQIALYGGLPGEPARVYLVPARGGAVRQLTHGEAGSTGDADETWSPDGTSLVYGATYADGNQSLPRRVGLEIVDLRTKHVSKLPDSEGLWSPRWSPDGRNIAALGAGSRLWLYTVETGRRTQLTTIGAGWPFWSRDGEYVYFEDNPGIDWCRVRIEDRKMDRVMSLAGLNMPAPSLSWVGLAPDGSPISTRDVGGTEIYALELEMP